MALQKIDWVKIKNEYINTDISQRKLAEKYSVSFNTLKSRANKESWATQREEERHKHTTAVQQKLSEKRINDEVNRLDRILCTSDKIHNKINEALEQLNIYIDDFGKEHETKIIDVSRLRKLMSILKDLSDVIIMSESNDKEIDKLDELIGRITNAAKP